jgi:hypothetical protein
MQKHVEDPFPCATRSSATTKTTENYFYFFVPLRVTFLFFPFFPFLFYFNFNFLSFHERPALRNRNPKCQQTSPCLSLSHLSPLALALASRLVPPVPTHAIVPRRSPPGAGPGTRPFVHSTTMRLRVCMRLRTQRARAPTANEIPIFIFIFIFIFRFLFLGGPAGDSRFTDFIQTDLVYFYVNFCLIFRYSDCISVFNSIGFRYDIQARRLSICRPQTYQRRSQSR